jgi:DNA-binding GntR family transcriptional regulator
MITHLSLADRVAAEVSSDVVTGKLAPGEALSEKMIADALGVSRSPVREAFHRLAREGLLIIQPRRGTTVAPITAAEAIHFYDTRILLETECARLAAPVMDDELLDRLRSTYAEMEQCAEDQRLLDYLLQVSAFHEAVHARCPNQVLVGAIQNMWLRAMRFRAVSIRSAGRVTRSCEQHSDLLAAFAERDGRRAASRSCTILTESKAAILRQLAWEQMHGVVTATMSADTEMPGDPVGQAPLVL